MTSPRSGYAMVLVLVCMVLFFSLWSVAYRHTAAALRIEAVHALQTQRDEGSIQALAKGLALLETGQPATSPYVCGVTMRTSTGMRSYTVTFTSEGQNRWSVAATPTSPGDNPRPMPATLGP
jgi:hypothetical protein